jgi:hypothetical protein
MGGADTGEQKRFGERGGVSSQPSAWKIQVSGWPVIPGVRSHLLSSFSFIIFTLTHMRIHCLGHLLSPHLLSSKHAVSPAM